MKQYKIAVFDLDGTILDTAEGLLAAVKYTIDKMGLTMLSDEQLLTFIGPPIQDSFEYLQCCTSLWRLRNLESAFLPRI